LVTLWISAEVVTTATSVWRTWKVNNMQRKITSSTPLVTKVILFCFIGGKSSVRGRFVHVRGRDDSIEESPRMFSSRFKVSTS